MRDNVHLTETILDNELKTRNLNAQMINSNDEQLVGNENKVQENRN